MKKSELKAMVRSVIKESSADDILDKAAQEALKKMDSKHNRSIIKQVASHHNIDDKELFRYIRDILDDDGDTESLLDRFLGSK